MKSFIHFRDANCFPKKTVHNKRWIKRAKEIFISKLTLDINGMRFNIYIHFVCFLYTICSLFDLLFNWFTICKETNNKVWWISYVKDVSQMCQRWLCRWDRMVPRCVCNGNVTDVTRSNDRSLSMCRRYVNIGLRQLFKICGPHQMVTRLWSF